MVRRDQKGQLQSRSRPELGVTSYESVVVKSTSWGDYRGLWSVGYSAARWRAPRAVMMAAPATNTRAAQRAAPASCDGVVGQIHGVLQAFNIASSLRTRYAIGPIQESPPPITAAEMRPMPVMPATLRTTSRVPPGRCAAAAPALSKPTAIPVRATAVTEPQVRKPATGGAFRLAERTVRGYRDDRCRSSLQQHRQLLGERAATGYPVPLERGAQDQAAANERSQSDGDAPAGDVQAYQS